MMMQRFGFGVFACLFCLMAGCPKTTGTPESSKLEPALETQVKKPAIADKPQPAIEKPQRIVEQHIIPLEDTPTFKKLHTAEIICMLRPEAQKDTNVPKSNVDNDWYVKIDGKSSSRTDGIGEIAFSSQADHFAYAAKQGSKYHLIADGNVKSSEYDGIEYITFSPDGKRLAYGARIGDKWFAVVDGNAGSKYDFVSFFIFSPDSRHFAYAARKQDGDKQTVVLDGVEICPAYDAIWAPIFSNDSKRIAFMAQDNFERFIVVDGEPDDINNVITSPVFSADSQHYAYFAEKGNERFLVFDGKAGTSFEKLLKQDVPVFGPNDNRVAFIGKWEENYFVVVNDQFGPFFDDIGDKSIALSVDGRSHAYAAKKGEKWCVVVNDQNGPFYDGIAADGPVFSNDGKRVAYGALLDGAYFLVVDHRPMAGYDNYDGIGQNSIMFSQDGRHLIYKVLKNKKWYMAVDGRLGAAYDSLLFEPVITGDSIEYLAERDGWLFACRDKIEPAAGALDSQQADSNKPRASTEETVTVDEQRLMPFEDAQNRQKIAYISDKVMVVVRDCPQERTDNLVLILGGTFRNPESGYYGKNITISNFYISRYEVTQKEWVEVMAENPSKFKGDNLPVETVSWYECVDYCNKRSIKEGLKPYYNIDKNNKDPNNRNDADDIKWTVTINAEADGYRLPTEQEWEYAAGGGQMSKSYTYSGSNDLDEVAWYWRNSGDEYQTGFWFIRVIQDNNNKTKPVGVKAPNELGLYDMSGNVREWCWDRHESDGTGFKERVWKGGGWLGVDFPCKPSFRGSSSANDRHPDTGFRVCRSR